MGAFDLILLALSGLPLTGAAYLCALAVLARRMPSPLPVSAAVPFITVVIPALDEERGIARTVASVMATDYPADRREVLVVADNCTDATAARARGAGARVLERHDPTRRGKGWALASAFAQLHDERRSDAVVVVDADTDLSANLLRTVAGRLAEGADAVQARYGVRNADASWRTRLLALALVLFHDVRSLARERFALSAGLRGNGMAFSREVLARVPYDAFSIVEDVEFGIALGRAGYRVHYAPEAWVAGDMAAHGDAARIQRERWETGRRALARRHGVPLVLAGLWRRDRIRLDLGMDLLVPPLASLVVAVAGGLLVSGGAVALGRSPLLVLPWLLAGAMLSVYVLRGVALTERGARGGLADLAWGPIYVAWKLVLRGRGARSSGGWIRTPRDERDA